MSTANWAIFKDMKMYNSKFDTTSNFESLFMLYDPETLEDPLPNSLFNLDTLKQIVSLGQEAPNILSSGANYNETWGEDFNLVEDEDWLDLANTLGLDKISGDEEKDSDIGVKRTYLLWLWMETLLNETIMRLDEGGSFQLGVLGTLGGTAFETEMTTMTLEFPMLTMAK